jgi:hypothetical protein
MESTHVQANSHSIAEEAVTLSGIHATINFYDAAGNELVGRRELRRFSHLAASIEQSLTLAPDPVTELQSDAARALAEINSRRVRR